MNAFEIIGPVMIGPSSSHTAGAVKIRNNFVQHTLYEVIRLSFLGVGISAPLASWGTLAQDARALIEIFPMQTAYPMLAICITIFAFNFVGEGLGTALDPKAKRQEMMR